MKGRFTVSAMLLATGLLTLLPRHSVHAAVEPAKTVEIHAQRFNFDPAEVTLKQDVPVTIDLHSLDATHGLRITELGLDLQAAKGAAAQQTITPDKPGDFVGHCSSFCGAGHGGMVITFHVVP